MIKSKEGITLVQLVVTIIVMLIIAGVVISLTIGDKGIVKQAENAVNEASTFENSSQYDRDTLYNEIVSPKK